MKKLLTATMLLAVLFSACKSEKKINSYSDIYSEKPTIIYLAPIYDKTQRKAEKYPADVEYNKSLDCARAFLYQTLSKPLQNKGYYVIGTMASKEIDKATHLSTKELRNGKLTVLANDYGIDAMLLVTIHRWLEENGKWIACLEYQLRSTKSNVDMMHTWVLATKAIPTDLKNDPVIMKNDLKFAQRYGMDNQTAQRCFLVEKVNDYVLRNLPTSVNLRQFEKDLYKFANPSYISYTWGADGGADVQPCSAEEYEEKAFL